MSDKKHIDRLFQERLKDFEASPGDAVWESIELELHPKKRKRRIIPLWWQRAGVAALLAVLFAIGSIVFNKAPEHNSTNNPVVNTDEKDNLSVPSSNNTIISNNDPDENSVVDRSNQEDLNSNSTSNTIVNQAQKSTTSLANTNAKPDRSGAIQNTNTAIQQTLKNSKNKNAVATNTDTNGSVKTSNLPEANQNILKTDVLIGTPDINTKTSVADRKSKEALSELNDIDSKKDSKTIEDAIAQVNNTDDKKEEEKLIRWNISTNVAPVYFNALGDGSSLDDQFIGNSKSGEINMSYGINGSYAITEKLKIRAGINKVNLGYNTNDVIVYSGAFSRSNSNIRFNDKSENTSLLSSQNLGFGAAPEILASNAKASIYQELGFIELPVEIEYAILNTKLGVNLIGGFSTFFLDKNKVYSTLNGDKSLLGEAKNINDTSYSANFGLGLNYNVSDKIKFNLEPTFKYQINTFRNTSGDFQPYFIGIYTGLSYKF
ncbi:hypothetical protein ACS386_02945 [Flavobacteriaceae bacterium LMO-SS05]